MAITARQLESLRSSLSPGVVARARAYLRAVQIVEADAAHVAAIVTGSIEYDVRIQVQGDDIIAWCTCPFFEDRFTPCKHIWAVVQLAASEGHLDALDRVHNPMLIAGDPDEDPDAFVDLDAEGEFTSSMRRPAVLGPPTPRGPHPAPRPREAWRDELQALGAAYQQQPVSSAPPWSSDAQVAFILEHASPDLPLRFAIRPVVREPRRKGGWTKPRGLTISAADVRALPLARQEQTLVARVLGAPSMYAPMHGSYASTAAPSYALGHVLAEDVVPGLCATGRLTIDSGDDLLPLCWDDGAAWRFVVDIGPAQEGQHTIHGALERADERLSLQEVAIHDGIVRGGVTLARLDMQDAPRWLRVFWARPVRQVPATALDEWLAALCGLPELLPLRPAPALGIAITSGTAICRLEIAGGSVYSSASARLRFVYGGAVTDEGGGAAVFDAAGRTIVRRDTAAERAAARRLDTLGVRRQYSWASSGQQIERSIAVDSIVSTTRVLSNEGWQVAVDGTPQRVLTTIDARVSSGIDWFDLEGAAHFGDLVVPLPDLLAALDRGTDTLALPDGSVGIISKTDARAWRMAARLGRRDGGRTRLNVGEMVLLDRLLEGELAARADAGVDALRARTRSYGGTAPVEAPPSFAGSLRPYQSEGLRWFAMLRDLALGGCLADDMGLGKTVMVLAWLDRLRASGVERPSLIVVPRSLVFNWIEEARRFTPCLRVLDLSHAARADEYASLPDAHVALCTYGTLRRDLATLQGHEFEYVVLDEAQSIKNASTATAKAARALRARHRLALTGTPIENRLTDLWSVLDFANPVLAARGGLGRLAPAGAASDDRQRIAAAVRPFVLRRTKAQVARDLPARTEQTISVELAAHERRLYDQLRDHYRARLLSAATRLDTGRGRMQVLEALLRLRQAACHPALVDQARRHETSAKLDQLVDQLGEVIAEGSKALVFSQFTSMLALVRARLDHEGHVYEYLDGQTRDRQTRVDRFQGDPACPLFLVSLKAGGVGLNLTAAEYVFLLDPWWNPAVEAQAIDRTHRIGQTRPVFAYRLVARDTVEDKVIALQQQKRELADAIIRDDHSVLAALTAEQLDALLS